MKEEIIELLKSFGYPVFLQGSLAEDEAYPESFITFWNGSTDDGSHYDNDAIYYVWSFDVNFYSSDPELVNTVPVEIIKLLRTNGWIISGRGYDVPSDEETHTGRAFNALYIEQNKKEE